VKRNFLSAGQQQPTDKESNLIFCRIQKGRALTMRIDLKPYIFNITLLCLILMLPGCGPKVVKQKVYIPPAIELKTYGRVGIFIFDCNAKGNLDRLMTQQFIEAIQQLQPGTPVLELGNLPGPVNPNYLKGLKQAQSVDVVFTGMIDVAKIKPKIGLATFTSLSVEADVEATLTMKLYETTAGSSLWTRSGFSKQTVAQISIAKGMGGSFSSSDPESAYGALSQSLIEQMLDDFSPHYEYR